MPLKHNIIITLLFVALFLCVALFARATTLVSVGNSLVRDTTDAWMPRFGNPNIGAYENKQMGNVGW